jgi:WD40 repeat protein/transcriptional regulator with XRE-family HTH domain
MGRKDKAIDISNRQELPLGVHMRRARQERGISLTAMAIRTAYTKNYLSAIENGNGRPSKELLGKYEQVLELEQGHLTQLLQIGIQPDAVVHLNESHKRPLREDWGEAPDVYSFYGRRQELTDLERWIAYDRCKVVTILGIGGVGKTSLANHLAKHSKHHFDYVFWSSLQALPSLESLLKKCILFVSGQRVITVPDNKEEQISLLLQYLRVHRCLLILDNFESVLQESNRVGVYREGYRGYGQLLQRLGEAEHQSCLILTSREKPGELLPLEGRNSPVRSMHLGGIELADGQQMLKDEDLRGSEEAWSALVQLYGGNPLALKLIAAPIRELFGGDITRFLEEGAPVFGGIYELVSQQFSRLSASECAIMYWLAIEQDAVAVTALRENIVPPVSMRSFQEALDSLRRRSLIEITVSSARCYLLPVIMEFVIEEFIARVREDIDSEDLTVLESHALMKAQSREYARNSQVQLLLRPLTEHLLNTLGKELSEQKLANMLTGLHERRIPVPGYAAANILNLLLQLGSDMQRYDFSHLVVWQAYLQGVRLPGVNFAYADLTNSVFTGAFGSILSLALSGDNQFLAAGTANGEIRLWHAVSGVPYLICQGHTDWVTSVAFSPDGTLLASGSDDKTVRLWRVSSGEMLDVFSTHTDWVRSVAFSPDGTLLASGSDDQTIRLWSVANGRCVKILQGHESRIYAVAFSPSGELLASGGEDQAICLWDVQTGDCLKTLQGHEGRVYTLAFNADGKLLASGSEDQSIRLWDTNMSDETSVGACRNVLWGHTGGVQSLAISTDGELLISGSSDHTIRLWQVKSADCLRTLQGHQGGITAIVLSRDGEWLYSASEDQTSRLWELSRGVCVRTLQGYSNRVYSIAFSADGELLASGSDDRAIRLWQVKTGQCLRTFQGYSTWRYSLAFSPDGRMLAGEDDSDRTIRIWNVHTGICVKTLQGHDNWVRSVAFSPDSTLLATGIDDHTVRFWQVESGEQVSVLQGHDNWVRSVAFSPDGALLASGSDDHTVRIWSVQTGECLQVLQGHHDIVYSVAFSSDGRLLASGSGDHAIRIWDVQTGECAQVLQGHRHWVWSAIFNQDGDLLVSGSEDQTIRVWRVDTGECLNILPGHSSWLQYVTFSPQTSIVASGGHDGTVKLWSAPNLAYLRVLRGPRPYEGMNILGVTGLTNVQKTMLKELGAVEQTIVDLPH